MARLLFLFVTSSILAFSQAELRWGKAYKWGTLNTEYLDEQSGMAASKKFTNRLYHNNDSGDGPFFYMTDLKGAHTREIKIKNWNPTDVEDMALGTFQGKSCLFLADIGDNDEERESIKYAVIVEEENFESEVTPLKVFHIQYPDRAHNAEATVVDSAGNLYVITKEKEGSAKVYKLSAEALSDSSLRKTFEYWGKIHLPEDISSMASLVTSAALSNDGKTLLLLTYNNLYEVQADFSNKLEISNAKTIKLQNLIQQESVTFLPDESGFLYSTEATTGSARIWRVDR